MRAAPRWLRRAGAWAARLAPLFLVAVVGTVALGLRPGPGLLAGPERTFVVSARATGAAIDFEGVVNSWPLGRATVCERWSDHAIRRDLPWPPGEPCDPAIYSPAERGADGQRGEVRIDWLPCDRGGDEAVGDGDGEEGSAPAASEGGSAPPASEGGLAPGPADAAPSEAPPRSCARALVQSRPDGGLAVTVVRGAEGLEPGTRVLLSPEVWGGLGALSFSGAATIGGAVASGEGRYLIEGRFEAREPRGFGARRNDTVLDGELLRGEEVSIEADGRPASGWGHLTPADPGDAGFHVVMVSQPGNTSLSRRYVGAGDARTDATLVSPTWVDRALRSPLPLALAFLASLGLAAMQVSLDVEGLMRDRGVAPPGPPAAPADVPPPILPPRPAVEPHGTPPAAAGREPAAEVAAVPDAEEPGADRRGADDGVGPAAARDPG